MKPSKADILAATERIASFIHHTPVLQSHIINDLVGANLYFKCENFQRAGAFKMRGATNAILSLKEKAFQNGVATHSSGNHAAALSLAAKDLGVKAFIVMPDNSSKVKIEAVKKYGGQITFCEATVKGREEMLETIITSTNAIEIHPYNNPYIIAGQATAAKELLDEVKSLDFIIAPVGGGGLLSGTALSAYYFSPTTTVIAAEPINADDTYRSFKSGKIESVSPKQTIADGLRTSLGTITFPIIMDHVSGILTVSEESIIEAMRLIWTRMKIIVEPSSAVPLAAILSNKEMFKNKKIGIIISGGNVDIDHLPW
jgi:threonine dehydratase